jgi:pectate lyase
VVSRLLPLEPSFASCKKSVDDELLMMNMKKSFSANQPLFRLKVKPRAIAHLSQKLRRFFSPRKMTVSFVLGILGLLLTLFKEQIVAEPARNRFMLSQVGSDSSLAFPEAQGFGAETVGGQGGRVILVTNLKDSGTGSLRSAVEAEGSRIVVFQVGGTITLNAGLEIRHPYITIAGQSAPGGGITLRNSPDSIKAPLTVKTHDVVLRYLRSRPGSNPHETGNLDALTIAGQPGQVYSVMIDHCSLSWATDEVASTFYDAHNITIQWSIISEGLDCATHIENGKRQCHSMGLLLGSAGAKNISIHHNLFAHNRRRNPLVKTAGITDIVNNVIYNPGFGENSFAPTEVLGDYGNVQVNYVSNYFKPGVNTGKADWFIDTKDEPVAVYVEGNQVPQQITQPNSQQWIVRRRFPTPAITTTSAQTAYQQVLAQAGASCGLNSDGTFGIKRDTIDQRIVAEVMQGTGHIINDPAEVGGWAVVAAGKVVPDRDRDGIPDAVETQSGLNPHDSSDESTDADGNGYTNLEDFLNGSCQPIPSRAP